MLMMMKVMLKQLQIEFPDEHMKKYWLDHNVELTKAELKYCVEGRMRAYANERGWHYTRKYTEKEQFPIELHWVWKD